MCLLPVCTAGGAAAWRQIQTLHASRASRVNLSRPPLNRTVRRGSKKSPSLCTTFRPLLSNHSLSVMFINCWFWNGRPCGFKKLPNFRVSSSDVAVRSVCWRNDNVSVTKIIMLSYTLCAISSVCLHHSQVLVLQFRLLASCVLTLKDGPTCDLSKLMTDCSEASS